MSKWASDEYNNSHPKLNEFGKEFIRLLSDSDEMEIKKVEIYKQYENIDVVLVINDGDYLICVEDKIDSNSHSNQLYKYKNNIINKNYISINNKEYKPGKIVLCYFKTGDQSSYLSPLSHGYNIVNRTSLLNLLEKYSDEIENDVFNDYFSYLKKFDKKKKASRYSLYKILTKELTLAFPEKERKAAITNWNKKEKKYSGIKKDDANQKVNYLKNIIDKEEIEELAKNNIFIKNHFTYVPNQSGGYKAFYWSNYNRTNYKTYLQIGSYTHKNETKYRLMLRVGSLEEKNNDEKKEIRNHLYNKFTEKYPEYYVKPTRFSIGNSMAFAVLKEYQNINFDELYKDKDKRNELIDDIKRTLQHMDEIAEQTKAVQ